MKITAQQGKVTVTWNDRGDDTGQYPQELFVDGLQYQLRSEQSLRDLYECLDFLFGRPGGGR